MSDTAAILHRKIISAGELESVVRTMKAIAASSLGQYENSVRSLESYYAAVQLGLVACLRHHESFATTGRAQKKTGEIGAIVFGSDQGLVGQFNDVMAEFVIHTLEAMPGKKTVWTVGERIQSRLADTLFPSEKRFVLPNSIGAVTPLVGQVLTEIEASRENRENAQIYLFHNRPQSGTIFTPICQRLLPLDDVWWRDLTTTRWPTRNLTEVMGGNETTLLAFIHEYLFVSLFRACAESLASENASRLAAMQRAEKNINELLEELNRKFFRLRQSDIDEELFDLVAGFEAMTEH